MGFPVSNQRWCHQQALQRDSGIPLFEGGGFLVDRLLDVVRISASKRTLPMESIFVSSFTTKLVAERALLEMNPSDHSATTSILQRGLKPNWWPRRAAVCLVSLARCYWLRLAESHITWRLMGAMLGRIVPYPLQRGRRSEPATRSASSDGRLGKQISTGLGRRSYNVGIRDVQEENWVPSAVTEAPTLENPLTIERTGG
jgi:hypothetical protein